jgi:hypothetical protein
MSRAPLTAVLMATLGLSAACAEFEGRPDHRADVPMSPMERAMTEDARGDVQRACPGQKLQRRSVGDGSSRADYRCEEKRS